MPDNPYLQELPLGVLQGVAQLAGQRAVPWYGKLFERLGMGPYQGIRSKSFWNTVGRLTNRFGQQPQQGGYPELGPMPPLRTPINPFLI